jgi:pyruvate/2-oxoglutarate dehydrogenase complex dihydrolipoamide acyltransferase (E2) component
MKSVEVRIPKWGLSIESMEIVEWLKGVGDSVTEGEAICEVATDKANSDIEAPATGTLTEVIAQPGTQCAVGDVIAMLEVDGD